MSDGKKEAGAALAEAKASLQTARISLDELDRLRAVTRGPLPPVSTLVALLGQSANAEPAKGLLKQFGARRRSVAGGYDLAARSTGIRVVLDENEAVRSIVLFGDGQPGGFSTWTGTLHKGLSMASTPSQVIAALGPAQEVHVDGDVEHQYGNNQAVEAYVFDDGHIAQLRLRRRT
jgi:hypothetical protein